MRFFCGAHAFDVIVCFRVLRATWLASRYTMAARKINSPARSCVGTTWRRVTFSAAAAAAAGWDGVNPSSVTLRRYCVSEKPSPPRSFDGRCATMTFATPIGFFNVFVRERKIVRWHRSFLDDKNISTVFTRSTRKPRFVLLCRTTFLRFFLSAKDHFHYLPT